MMGSNHHMAKPVRIGEVQADGQFSIVYNSRMAAAGGGGILKALPPKAWSPYVEANKGKAGLVMAVGLRRLHLATRCRAASALIRLRPHCRR